VSEGRSEQVSEREIQHEYERVLAYLVLGKEGGGKRHAIDRAALRVQGGEDS